MPYTSGGCCPGDSPIVGPSVGKPGCRCSHHPVHEAQLSSTAWIQPRQTFPLPLTQGWRHQGSAPLNPCAHRTRWDAVRGKNKAKK